MTNRKSANAIWSNHHQGPFFWCSTRDGSSSPPLSPFRFSRHTSFIRPHPAVMSALSTASSLSRGCSVSRSSCLDFALPCIPAAAPVARPLQRPSRRSTRAVRVRAEMQQPKGLVAGLRSSCTKFLQVGVLLLAVDAWNQREPAVRVHMYVNVQSTLHACCWTACMGCSLVQQLATAGDCFGIKQPTIPLTSLKRCFSSCWCDVCGLALQRYDPVTTGIGSLLVTGYCVVAHDQSVGEALNIAACATVLGMVSCVGGNSGQHLS